MNCVDFEVSGLLSLFLLFLSVASLSDFQHQLSFKCQFLIAPNRTPFPEAPPHTAFCGVGVGGTVGERQGPPPATEPQVGRAPSLPLGSQPEGKASALLG